MTIELLLRRHAASGDDRVLEVARRALDAMAAGGIHDQLGGKFHRYSTDARWLVPHFEQMLYDNAQLARSTPMHGRSRAMPCTSARCSGRSTTCCGSCGPTAAGSRPARMPTPRARRVRRSCGPRRRPARSWVTTRPCSRPRTASARRATGRAARSCPASSTARSWPSGSARPRPLLRRGSRPDARRSSIAVPGDPSPPATTRCWPPGTALRSRRSPTPPGSSRQPATQRWSSPARATAMPRSAPRPTSWVACVPPTVRCVARGRMAGRRPTGSSRTTRISPMGCSRCTRRRSTSAGTGSSVSLAEEILARFADPAGGFFDTARDGERLVVRPRDL